MVKNGKGGGNTKTGLIFEGKTDLGAFLSTQKGYEIRTITENVSYNGTKQKVCVRTVFFNNEKAEGCEEGFMKKLQNSTRKMRFIHRY